MTQLAFPTAYGAGSYVTGGRGQTVYHVTNLNNSGTGSLRQAVIDANSNGGGTIVFDVSGIINISSTLGFGDNMTIAGQTAPQGGITIDGERVFVGSADNLIVRHIRFKGGVDGDNDSVTVRNEITNQIWDHCSFAFGRDEGASWYETQSQYTADNVTIQRCLFGENSKGSILGMQDGTVGELSFNKNLFYNNSHRFPNTAGRNGKIEVINNIVWNVGSRLVRTNGSGQQLNHIGNYYHYNNRGINNDRINAFSYSNGYPEIYTNDNLIIAPSTTTPLSSTVAEMNVDNKLSWKHFIDGTNTPLGTRNKGDQLEAQYFVDTQHPLLGRFETILTPTEAFTEVLNDVGCNKRINNDGISFSDNLDFEDTDYLFQISQGNYNTPLGNGSYNVQAYNGADRPSNFYQSNAHIPEAYFTANGITGNATIHNDIQPSGYSMLEEYLNQVDGPIVNIPIITLNGNSVVNLNVGDTYTELGATATDVEDGDLTSSIVVTGSVDTNTAGTYQLFYNVQDSESNSAIQVVRTINVNSVVQNTVYSLSDNEIFKSKRSKLSLIKRGSL